MKDLQATVQTARSNLRRLWDAYEEAWRQRLDCGPGAWQADGMPVHRGDPAEGSPIRYRSGPCDCGENDWPTGGHDPDCGRRPAESNLSAAYDTSVRQLAAALVPASELPWIDDGYAQGSVLPHNQSHIPLHTALNINTLVTAALHATTLMLKIDPDPADIDARYVQAVCTHILNAVMALPDDLIVDPPDGMRRAKPSHKRCSNCDRWIPWTINRCTACQERLTGWLQKDPDQRDNAPAQIRCIGCDRVVQDRGSRCYGCRQRKSRAERAS